MTDFLRKYSRHIVPCIAVILITIVCCSVLFTNGGSGLSDNGDFQRVMDANGLQMADSSHSRYIFKRHYTMVLDENNELSSIFKTVEGQYLYKSPHFTFIKISKFLNYTANIITGQPATNYDIFYLALIYIAILCAGAYLIIYFFKKPVHQIIASVLFILMFCDSGHLVYFNSLYGEGLQFVSLTLIVGLILALIDKRVNILTIAALFISIYYFAGSKLANIPLALLITAGLFVFLPNMKKIYKWIFSFGAVAVAVSLAVMYVSIPSWMNEQTTYQTVFFGILKESPTPEKDIEELGLPKEYIALQNTHAYMGEYPIDITTDEFRHNFYDKIGKMDAVGFYIKHPVRFIGKSAMAIRECTSIHPIYLGTSPHVRMGKVEKFNLWSNIRGGNSIFTNPNIMLPILFAFAILSLIAVIVLAKKKKMTTGLQIWSMLLILICGIWANILLPIAGNGDADLLKHMYLFIHMTDILLFFGIMFICHISPKIITTKKRAIITASALAVVMVIAIIPKGNNKTITFGTFNGTPIEWIEMYSDGESTTYIAKDVLFEAPFDMNGEYGYNLWAESDIRRYLNGEFLDCFTPEELSQLKDTSHEVTLSQAYSDLAEAGWHTPYWRASQIASANMYEDTYRHTVTDKVYLPDTLQYSKGLFEPDGEEFYLGDPYGSSDSMVRFVDKNGVPVYCDASVNMGIRPVITIRKD
ncbi:MAG: hypothetical protein IKB50_00335 [Clostridia bacterium]|nr:hypothetical protein [Clostridia bacterium]